MSNRDGKIDRLTDREGQKGGGNIGRQRVLEEQEVK